MFQLTKDEKEYFKTAGFTEEEIKQIENAYKYTTYTMLVGDDEESLTAEEAMKILGRRKFVLGLERSAFHRTASQEHVYFDSSEFFRHA